MSRQHRYAIFYFEDDPDSLGEFIVALREKYEVTIGAHPQLVFSQRKRLFDLLILDLMIHHESSDEQGNLVSTLWYEGTPWDKTGLEFLRRVRLGEYETFGFGKGIPVIVATARVTQDVKAEAETLGYAAYLEKPFTVDSLCATVEQVLGQVT